MILIGKDLNDNDYNQLITEIRIKPIKGSKPLKGNQLKDFKDFLEFYADKIIQKWVDYFIFLKDEFERINKRLK